MSHEPRQESTESDERAESGLPADQGAREALVEQLAEAILLADDDWERDPVHATGTWDAYLARAVEPLVTAQVEAAVSERDEARADLRALREGLETLATYLGPDGSVTANAITQILASSPAEGPGDWFRQTPESLAMLDEERKALAESEDAYAAASSPAEGTSEAVCCGDHDEDGGRPCNGCPERAPVSSGEAGEAWVDRHGDVWTFDEDGIGNSPECANFSRKYVEKKWGPLRPAPVSSGEARDPASPCRCHPADDDSGHCGGWMPPAPVATPSAEGSEP